MTVDYTAQHLLFLWSVVAGAALSLFYDFFRLIRALGLRGRFSVFAEDIVFCLVSATVYILLLFNFSDGVLRLYALIGMAAGFLLCHLTVGALFMKCVDGIKRAVFGVLHRVKAFTVRLYAKYKKRREEKKEARAEQRKEQNTDKDVVREQNKTHRGKSKKHREEKGKANDKKNKRKRNG